MIVTAWNNGGSGYGIKVKPDDRDRFFKRAWKTVILECERSLVKAQVNVAKKSFWSPRCRELIKKEIGDWLEINGLKSWPDSHPPKLWLEHLGNHRFLLRRLRPGDE